MAKVHTHTALAPCAPRCALAWGFTAVKGVGNGLLRVRSRAGNVKGRCAEAVWEDVYGVVEGGG